MFAKKILDYLWITLSWRGTMFVFVFALNRNLLQRPRRGVFLWGRRTPPSGVVLRGRRMHPASPPCTGYRSFGWARSVGSHRYWCPRTLWVPSGSVSGPEAITCEHNNDEVRTAVLTRTHARTHARTHMHAMPELRWQLQKGAIIIEATAFLQLEQGGISTTRTTASLFLVNIDGEFYVIEYWLNLLIFDIFSFFKIWITVKKTLFN